MPTSIYEGTTFPRIKGVPFERDVAPQVNEIASSPPQLPAGSSTWEAK